MPCGDYLEGEFARGDPDVRGHHRGGGAEHGNGFVLGGSVEVAAVGHRVPVVSGSPRPAARIDRTASPDGPAGPGSPDRPPVWPYWTSTTKVPVAFAPWYWTVAVTVATPLPTVRITPDRSTDTTLGRLLR